MSRTPVHRQVLITGGAGFIGSHLVDVLLAQGAAVTVVDDLSTGRQSNLDPATAAVGADGDRLEVRVATVSDALEAMRDRRFDAIYHLAAAVGVRLVVEDPAASAERNVTETAAVLRFAAAARTPILVASSSEVYGKGVRSPFREDDDLAFGPPTVSRWSYGLSKAIDEQLALAMHRSEALPVTVARFFNTVGPRQRGRWGMVLPRFVAAAVAGQPLDVHGTGAQVRCFCDVRDVATALPRLLADPAHHGRVFNVGADEPISIESLAGLVIETLGSRSTIRRIPHAEVFGPGFEDLEVRVPDLARIRAAIGFVPTIPLRRTITDVAAEMARAPEVVA